MKKRKISDRAVEYILMQKVEDLGRLTGVKIASAMGVTPSYLCRKFKSDQKIGLDEFITREKIHEAIFLLEKDREISIAELAGRLGFPGTAHFIAAFMGYTTVGPEKYREFRFLNPVKYL